MNAFHLLAGFTPLEPCDRSVIAKMHLTFFIIAISSLVFTGYIIKQNWSDLKDHPLQKAVLVFTAIFGINIIAAVLFTILSLLVLKVSPLGASCDFTQPEYMRLFFLPAILIGWVFVRVVDALNGK